jgi:hypothetical protein
MAVSRFSIFAIHEGHESSLLLSIVFFMGAQYGVPAVRTMIYIKQVHKIG